MRILNSQLNRIKDESLTLPRIEDSTKIYEFKISGLQHVDVAVDANWILINRTGVLNKLNH